MKTNGCYYVTVIEDLDTNRIAGSATLFTEYKFIHGGGLVNMNRFFLFSSINNFTDYLACKNRRCCSR